MAVMNPDDDRYAGRPLLKLLDAYVLDAIGMLDEPTAADMEAMAPQVAAALSTSATQWQQVIAEALGLPDRVANQIRRLWSSSQADASAQGAVLDPLTFAHFVADSLVAESPS